MVNFGNKLKTLRTEKKLTQKQLADRVGLATSAISSYEAGSRYPTYEILIKFSRIFHVTTDYLLGIKDTRTLDLSDLQDDDIEILSLLADKLRRK